MFILTFFVQFEKVETSTFESEISRNGEREMGMRRCHPLGVVMASFLAANSIGTAAADGTIKIGLVIPMTGIAASTGKQIDNAVKLYMLQNGDTVAGKKIEVIVKDDAALPDNTKRITQELIVNDKVNIIAGFGVTPGALAIAPLATQAEIPAIVMAAGTSIIPEKSPFIVRTSFTLPQSSAVMGEWAAVKKGWLFVHPVWW